ncbi:MAG: cell division protein ZapA [Acidiferrobacterales bacterium]|nr:cell division protein ZapA [Acidiferrobacterales bacterium]
MNEKLILNEHSQILKIKVGGRHVSLACALDQRQSLLNAASALNAEISIIQNSSATTAVTFESAVIIAALNFAAQIIENSSPENQLDFDDLIDKIDATLAD